MCKCWRWQEPFFKRTPRSPPLHRRGWQRCDWAHKLSNSICLSWHFHSDPGSTDGQRLVGKKTALCILWHKPPSRLSSLCAESIRNPLFTSLFCSSLSTQAHKMATNITARPITRFWWIQSYSPGTYLACWPDYLFCLSSLFILLVQHNIALLWEFMQMHWAGCDCNYALIYTAVADHFAIRGCGCICFIFAFEFTGNFFHFF